MLQNTFISYQTGFNVGAIKNRWKIDHFNSFVAKCNTINIRWWLSFNFSYLWFITFVFNSIESNAATDDPSINVNKDHIEQNRDELELTNNVKDKNIKDQINESSKTSITTNRNLSDNDNNTPSDICNNIVIFADSIAKGINIRNFNTRLSTAYCKCRFFGSATSKHFHHYIQPTLNEANVKTDITVVHMGTNYILNAKANKDLIAESVLDIPKECVRFGVIDVFISSVTVNTRRSSAFISAVNKILEDKCTTHQFHFIDNSNTKNNTPEKMFFI